MTFKWPLLVLGQTQFMGSEFGNFGGFRWVFCSVLVCELGFRRVWSLISRVRSSSKFEVFSKIFIVFGFVGSEFQILEGFGWICSSVLVGKPGFKRVRSSQFEIHYFWVQPNTNPYPELSEYVISSSRGNYFTRLLSFGRSVKYKYRAMNNFFSSEDFQPNMFKSETDNLI